MKTISVRCGKCHRRAMVAQGCVAEMMATLGWQARMHTEETYFVATDYPESRFRDWLCPDCAEERQECRRFPPGQAQEGHEHGQATA